MSRDGRGWHGDEKGHREAALKGQAEQANNTQMRRDEDDDAISEAWMKKAKLELEKKLGVKTKVRTYGYYENLGALALESIEGIANNGEREWIVFPDSETAEEAAVQKVREDLENEPEVFTQSWLQNFVKISETDKRIIADEEATCYAEGIKDEDDGDRIIGEANLEEELAELQEKLDNGDVTEEEFEKEKEELVDKAYEKLVEERTESIEVSLDDPIRYFVDEQGLYSTDDLLKQSFIQIDIDKAAQDAIDTDGVGHFIDVYDGSEVELPSGAVAYGTN